jgi:hypothetical protein
MFGPTEPMTRVVVLQRKDIIQVAIVFLCPQMIAIGGVDQLAGNTHAVGRLAYAAL